MRYSAASDNQEQRLVSVPTAADISYLRCAVLAVVQLQLTRQPGGIII